MMKILPMHFRNPKEGKKEARDPADNSEISRVGMKAIEWMLDKQVDLTDVSTWQGVEYKLTHLESHSLRDLQASKVSETNIPRSKAQRVNAIMDFLTREMKHWKKTSPLAGAVASFAIFQLVSWLVSCGLLRCAFSCCTWSIGIFGRIKGNFMGLFQCHNVSASLV